MLLLLHAIIPCILCILVHIFFVFLILGTIISILFIISFPLVSLVNPFCACAVRVTVVGSVCVCPLINISPLERLFVLKTISRTEQAMPENASFKSYCIICHAVAYYHADVRFFDDKAF